jgi:hypothetical protein
VGILFPAGLIRVRTRSVLYDRADMDKDNWGRKVEMKLDKRNFLREWGKTGC